MQLQSIIVFKSFNTCVFISQATDKVWQNSGGASHYPSSQETEAGGSGWVWGQPGLHNEFKGNLNYITRSCHKNRHTCKQKGTQTSKLLLKELEKELNNTKIKMEE